MKKTLTTLFLIIITPLLGDGLQQDINRSARIVEEFNHMPERGIPSQVLNQAKGVAIISVLKGGFIFSGRIGSGLVVAKTSDGWSAPSAIGIGGAGWGLQVGAQVTDFVFILNTDAAVAAFASGGSLTLGGDVSVAAGPVGRNAELGVSLPPALIYSYSRTKGAFAGVSVQGTVILTRDGANANFYGRPVTSHELLYGKVPPPKSAAPLYRALDN